MLGLENTDVGKNDEYGFEVSDVEKEGDSSRGAGEVFIDGAVEFGGVKGPIEDGENMPELNINAGGEELGDEDIPKRGLVRLSFCRLLQNQTRTTSFSRLRVSDTNWSSSLVGLGF